MSETDVIIKYSADIDDVAEKLDELIKKLERVRVLFSELGIKNTIKLDENFGCCPEITP